MQIKNHVELISISEVVEMIVNKNFSYNTNASLLALYSIKMLTNVVKLNKCEYFYSFFLPFSFMRLKSFKHKVAVNAMFVKPSIISL